jgi:hypothetical protein
VCAWQDTAVGRTSPAVGRTIACRARVSEEVQVLIGRLVHVSPCLLVPRLLPATPAGGGGQGGVGEREREREEGVDGEKKKRSRDEGGVREGEISEGGRDRKGGRGGSGGERGGKGGSLRVDDVRVALGAGGGGGGVAIGSALWCEDEEEWQVTSWWLCV